MRTAFPARWQRSRLRLCTLSLVELGDSEAIDLFLREEDARTALEDAIRDEPEWAGLLYVKPVDLDEREVSAN